MKINLYYRTTHNGIPPDFLDKKQYHCSQCPEIFFNVQKFKSHESKHHGLWKPGQKLKQYQCKTCLEMFSGKRNYIAHCEKAHNEIIPLHHVDAIKCHSCEMIFSGMYSLVLVIDNFWPFWKIFDRFAILFGQIWYFLAILATYGELQLHCPLWKGALWNYTLASCWCHQIAKWSSQVRNFGVFFSKIWAILLVFWASLVFMSFFCHLANFLPFSKIFC